MWIRCNQPTRVALAVGLIVGAGSAAAYADAIRVDTPETLTLYSPAAPPNILWSMNVAIGNTLDRCSVAREVQTVPTALPDAINRVGGMADRATHLPIVTTVDFTPAVNGTGPDWHPYNRPHGDLQFVAALYEVGFGVTVFDPAIEEPADLKGKIIAVPRRPSSLRVLAETLLRDGWGILDQVTLVDLPPSAVAPAAAAGRIHATTWNLMVQTPEGYRALLPPLLELGRWLPVQDADVARINDANGFTTARVDIDRIVGAEPATAANPRLLSFRQALTAWSSTDNALVTAMLECLTATQESRAAFRALGDWPGLTPAATHPAAHRFFQDTPPVPTSHQPVKGSGR